MTKAISLLSGGLDSILATRIILEQGIEVEAVNFVTAFCNCTSKGEGCLASQSAASSLGIKLKVFEVTKGMLEIIKNPKHGYGRNINPCIDCRIFMFKNAKEYMKEAGASFIVTGEVLGERPMSQRKQAIDIIEKESGLDGLILRPLSAKLFKPSIPEKEGLVDREKLLSIQGRCRQPQIKLAEDFNIKDYPCPAGGCLLTYREFANKMKDLMEYNSDFDVNDVRLLKIGRHIRITPKAKLVVGRDEKENNKLLTFAKEGDMQFYPTKVPGPTAIGRGSFGKDEIALVSSIIARYSDTDGKEQLEITYQILSDGKTECMHAPPVDEDILSPLRI